MKAYQRDYLVVIIQVVQAIIMGVLVGTIFLQVIYLNPSNSRDWY